MPNQNQWSVFKRLLTYLKPYKFCIWEISFLRVCPIVLSGIFAEMPLPIWKNWGCPTLTKLQQALSFLA